MFERCSERYKTFPRFKPERERERGREEARHKETEGIRGHMRAGSTGRLSITSISGGAAHVSELL